MNIILAKQFVENDTFDKELMKEIASRGYNAVIVNKYNMRGVLREVQKTHNYHTLIIQEYVEAYKNVEIEFLNKVEQENPDINIIFIISENRRDDKDYLKKIYKNKIYNVLFENDAYVKNIVNLIINRRKPKATRAYFKIDLHEEQNHNITTSIVSEEEIHSITAYLEKALEIEDLYERYENVVSKYNEQQNVYILSRLSSELSMKLEENKSYKRFQEIYEDAKKIEIAFKGENVIQENGLSSQNKSISRPKNKVITKEIIKSKILGQIVITVGGTSGGAGTTHTSIGVATFLKNCGKKVAVLGIDSSGTTIDSLKPMGKRTNKRYFNMSGIDFYFKSKFENTEDFHELLSHVNKNDYDYIVLDLGVLKYKDSDGRMRPNKGYFEMFRSQFQILCIDGSPWKSNTIHYYRYDDFAEVEPNIGNWNLVVNLVNEKDYRNLKRDIKEITVLNKIFKAPIYLNPFIPEEDVNEFFHDLLDNISPYSYNKTNDNKILKVIPNLKSLFK